MLLTQGKVWVGKNLHLKALADKRFWLDEYKSGCERYAGWMIGLPVVSRDTHRSAAFDVSLQNSSVWCDHDRIPTNKVPINVEIVRQLGHKLIQQSLSKPSRQQEEKIALVGENKPHCLLLVVRLRLRIPQRFDSIPAGLNVREEIRFVHILRQRELFVWMIGR